MASTPTRSRRLPPAERRAMLAAAGAAIALDEGLESVTLRSVAARAEVAYGLLGHYFGSAEELRAAAFRAAVGADLAATAAAVAPHTTPTTRLRALLDRWVSPLRDPVGLLWLDAWSRARSGPELRSAVAAAMRDGHELVVGLLHDGAAAGELDCPHPAATAWRLLTLLDGQIVHSSLDLDDRPVDIRTAIAEWMEREVGLATGTLGSAAGGS